MDSYFKTPKLYGMEKITTEEVMDRLDISQTIFGKVDEFGWWDMERIKTDFGTQFTSKYFQERLFVHGIQLSLVVSDH